MKMCWEESTIQLYGWAAHQLVSSFVVPIWYTNTYTHKSVIPHKIDLVFKKIDKQIYI